MNFELLLLSALALDALLGDPRWYPHPVRMIGLLAQYMETITRRTIAHEKAAGVVTVLIILILPVAVVSALLFFAGRYSPHLQDLLAVLLLYSLVAVRDLLVHSRAVYQALVVSDDIGLARMAVGRIVGRDTEHLQSDGICRACIETVGENMVDGITAPLFWAILFSCFAELTPLSGIAMAAVGITLYKTVNTMDSMFGYKNDRYLRFGWAAARLDDAFNFLPARLSGIIVAPAAFLLGFNGQQSWRIFLRDRLNHSSPNAAHTEAAIAGALELRLGGPSFYFGKEVGKPFIGDGQKEALPRNILDANTLILVSSLIFIAGLLLLKNIGMYSLLALR